MVAWMADLQQQTKLSHILQSLSALLNRTLRSGRDFIPLSEELDYIRWYLDIQQYRGIASYRLNVSIDDSLLDCLLPPFTLEPLVENWSKYGMSGTGQSRLSIKGAVSGGRWSITVTDNGPGFSQEIMEELTSKMDGVVREGKIPDLHIHKMGLLNIFIRLHYAYGKECIFQVENTPQGSGQVTIGGSYHVDESAH